MSNNENEVHQRNAKSDNRQSEDVGVFPTPTCPCGAEQPDPERLYCENCIVRLGADLVAYLEAEGTER